MPTATKATFDVVGVGLNATDTLLLVPQFPHCGGKVAFHQEILSPGGQVTSAMVACAKLGLRAKYIGTVGDDLRGQVQMESLLGSGINLDDVQIMPGCPNQSAYIIIDQSTGERTVFWNRQDCLALSPDSITEEMIACARMMHTDGLDIPAVERAASIARTHGIPVLLDIDAVYPGFERVLAKTDYLITSSEFPGKWTRQEDPLAALVMIQRQFGMKVSAMTLGAYGALAWCEGEYVYSPGFEVPCRDTTGAGDVFHGAFCYAVLQGMEMSESLEFSNAMAALNCTALGARGAIAGLSEAQHLIATGVRHIHPRYEKYLRP